MFEIKNQELLSKLNIFHLDLKLIQAEIHQTRWISFSSGSSLCRPECNAATIHVTLSKSHQLYNDSHQPMFKLHFHNRCLISHICCCIHQLCFLRGAEGQHLTTGNTLVQLSLPESWHNHSVCLRKDSSGPTPRSCSFTVQCPDGQQLLLQSIFHHRVKRARERVDWADFFPLKALMFSVKGCQRENVWPEPVWCPQWCLHNKSLAWRKSG